ncbi:MAG: 4-hydroxythreonine-4-phosphate dehydrogenase PdxA [Candidatus Margulisiibacteriota bacterium]|jgi:4-hydroxythreonine-4-phosphate dehydrogenase
MNFQKLKIAITLGDPGGIGPEIVFNYLKNNVDTIKKLGFIPVVFGSSVLLENEYLRKFIPEIKFKIIAAKELAKIKELPITDEIIFVDCYPLNHDFVTKKPDAISGLASFSYLESAMLAIEKGQVQALVTAPICKESFTLAGLKYQDHTSYLKEKTQSSAVSMGFWTMNLKTVLVTIHKALKDVPGLITKEALSIAINNTLKFAKLLKIDQPKIALAGLNPHASENGLFGDEENKIIIPALKKIGANIIGPLPADTVYFRAYQKEFDFVISMYHDQALIPIKLLAFESAVNISLGLPFIRTSPDHGTAFDRAYECESSFHSFANAVELVLQCQD